MLDFLKKLFRKLLNFIKKYWWLILIVVVFFMPQFATFLKGLWSFIGPKLTALWGTVKTMFTGVMGFADKYGWKTTLAVGLGALSVLSPDTAGRIVKNVADVASDAVEAGANAASKGIGALLKNPLVLGAGALTLLYLTRKKEPA